MNIYKECFKLIDIKKFKFYFFFIITFFTINSLLELIGLSFILLIISFFLNNGDLNFGFLSINQINEYLNLSDFKLFMFIISLVFIFYLFKSFYFIFIIYFKEKFLNLIYLNLSDKLFNYYKKIPLNNHYNLNNSTIVKNIYMETNASSYGFFDNFIMLILEGILIISLFLILLFYNPYIFIITSIFLLTAYLIIYFFINKKITYLGNDRYNFSQYLHQHLTEFFALKLHLPSFRLNNFMKDNFYKSNIDYVKNTLSYKVYSNLPRLILELIFVLSVLLISSLAFILSYEFTKVIELLSIYIIISLRILPALGRSKNCLYSLSFRSASIKNLYSIIYDNENFYNLILKDKEIINFNKTIKLHKFTYRYPNSKKNIFDSINLEIKKNNLYYIIGESGSGKTTLINSLIGNIKPIDGSLLIDGKSLNNHNCLNYGYVPQNPHIIDASLRSNVTLLDNSHKEFDKKIQIIFNKLNLDKLLNNFNYDLSSNLGEKGLKISGGEKQRIVIARALLNDPDILIFDEPTSSLDRENKLNFKKIINYLAKKYTIIIISHNKDMINENSTIISVDNGLVKI